MNRFTRLLLVLLLISSSSIVNSQTSYLEGGFAPDQFLPGMTEPVAGDAIGREEGHFLFKSGNGNMQPLACPATNILASGLPAWTNFWTGYQFNINNISANPITINCFEARFGGTSGYRIYTKTGTFIGFQTIAGAWTLLGSVGGLVGLGAFTYSPIPIAVGVTIPAGATQAFYLTRTDNVVANRHMYIVGAGPAGVAVYAADVNLQLVEGHYIDNFFVLIAGIRRPTIRVYYDPVIVLPTELLSFNARYDNGKVKLTWETATETNTDYFVVERSTDGKIFNEVTTVQAAGNSSSYLDYSAIDSDPVTGVAFYRLKQVDRDGEYSYSDWATVKYNDNDFELQVYPNPTNKQDINLSITGELNQEVSVEVYDYMGNLHFTKKMTLSNGHHQIRFNSGRLSAGVYFVKATSEGTRHVQKIIVSR